MFVDAAVAPRLSRASGRKSNCASHLAPCVLASSVACGASASAFSASSPHHLSGPPGKMMGGKMMDLGMEPDDHGGWRPHETESHYNWCKPEHNQGSPAV